MNEDIGISLENMIIKDEKMIWHAAHAFSSRIEGTEIELDDLFQEAALGYMKAYESYDASFGVKLQTHTYQRMRSYISNFLRDKRGVIKYPPNMQKIWGVVSRLELDVNDFGAIAEASNQEVHYVKWAMQHYGGSPLSFDMPADSEDEENEDFYALHGQEDDFSGVFIADIMNLLNDREKFVLEKYMQGNYQSEIGEMLGVRQSNVSYALSKIKKKIRDYQESSDMDE